MKITGGSSSTFPLTRFLLKVVLLKVLHLTAFLLTVFLLAALPLPALLQEASGQTANQGKELLIEALTCENAKDYANAFKLYLQYEETHRASSDALRGMSRTAKQADMLDTFRTLLKDRFNEYRTDVSIARFYLESLYKSGSLDEALLAGSECLRRWPSSVELMRNVATMYRSNKMLDEAVEVLENGRVYLHKENLYSRDIAELLFQKGDYRDSIDEYLKFLKDHEKSVSYVERRLLDIARVTGDTALVVEKVRKTESGEKCGWSLPLLIDLELAAGLYDRALASVLACSRDRDANMLIQELLRLARMAARGGSAEVARRALEEAVASCSGTRPEVRIGLASDLSRMGFVEEALVLFEALVGEKLTSGERIECYESLGDLYLDVLDRPEDAIVWYQKLDGEGVAPEHTTALSLKVAEAMIADGRLDEGLGELLALEANPVGGTLKERITFEIGNAYFYSGRLEEAVRYYRKLADTAPSFKATSEALDVLRLERTYGEKDGKALGMLGSARYAERLGDRKEARDRYVEAASLTADPRLRDEIDFLLASALGRWGSTGEALALFEKVAGQGAEDYIAARALMEVGRIRYGVLGDNDAARVVFEKLILEFGSVIETEEARHLLAEIEGRM